MECNTYYGGYRSRTFADIFPSFTAFEEAYNATDLKINFNNYLTLSQLYYMLYAHYGNSHIAMSDENQFKYYMWAIIYQYGPVMLKKREVQIKLTELTEDDITKGGKAIYNHSFNPGTAPSTNTLEELTTINDQNTTNYKKSKLEGYSALWLALDNDVVDDFIHKFKRLFLTVVAPDYPLLYTTYTEDN